MMGDSHPLEVAVRVSGASAQFTPPSTRGDMGTYLFPTPSGVQGALSSILGKPQFIWLPTEIRILRPIRTKVGMYNHINKVGPTKRGFGPISVAKNRTQQRCTRLVNVAYVVKAVPCVRRDVRESPRKYQEMFMRRVEKGQCFRRPYLGVRECRADFGLPDPTEMPEDINIEQYMLLGVDFAKENRARFFTAAAEGGVVQIDLELYRALTYTHDYEVP